MPDAPDESADRTDARLEHLIRSHPPADPASRPGPCPDRNLLAALASGTLLDAERAPLEAHAAVCAACADAVAVAALAASLDEPVRAAAPPPRSGRVRSFAAMATVAAAAAVLAVVAFAWNASREPPRRDTETALVAAAGELSARRADLFAGFEPLGPDERAAPVDDPVRGTPVGAWPRGHVRSQRPEFRWDSRPGAQSWDLRLCAGDGTEIWRRTCAAPPFSYPSDAAPLTPGGRYLFVAEARGALGTVEARSAFGVLDDAAARAFDDGVAEIRRVFPDALGPLLASHFALRRQLVDEALGLAREAATAAPDDPVARDTLRCARAAAGAAESR